MAAKTSDTESAISASQQAQLERLKAEVAALREQLCRAQRLAAMGTMTAMVAHEFNNILTPIINYAQLAQKNPNLTGKALAKAADGGQRASHICKAILGMVCPSAADCRKVSADEVIHETLAAMAREPEKDSIVLEVDASANVGLVTRPVELQHVLLNLLLNARAAVLEKSGPRRITVRAESRRQDVIFQVADNGIGIPPENLARIFEPFFTTKPRNGDIGGSGLGLTICREVVAALEGEISVESKVGNGTTFTVRLPAVLRPAQAAKTA